MYKQEVFSNVKSCHEKWGQDENKTITNSSVFFIYLIFLYKRCFSHSAGPSLGEAAALADFLNPKILEFVRDDAALVKFVYNCIIQNNMM